jgi:two-component sensor histidine kinase
VQVIGALVLAAIGVLVWLFVPRILALPSAAHLARSNEALARVNESLETAVETRTQELARANERFELALSQSNITVFTQDADLNVTWVHNPAPGLTSPSGHGGGTTPQAEEMKRRVLATGQSETGPVAVASPEDGIRHFQFTVSPTRSQAGVIDGLLCTAVDVTEKRQFDVRLASLATQVAAAYRRFQLALDNSSITVFEQDTDLRYTFLYNPPPGVDAEACLGRSDEELLPEGRGRDLVAAKQRALQLKAPGKVEVELEVAGTPRYYDIRLEPKLREDGGVEGLIGTAVDLTEQKRGDRQMRLGMRERTHRSKNLLAVVQAMARKTASMAPDIDTFIRDFSARLRAIAAAHDLLVAESWSGAELRDLLVASLSQSVDLARPEVRIDGPPIKLTPDTAQTLGLAFHELTMNAGRHGALSVPEGRLFVGWRRENGMVHLEWREEGGPPVAPPTRTGFGRILLERLVGASLDGQVKLDFRPSGLVCHIDFREQRIIVP